MLCLNRKIGEGAVIADAALLYLVGQSHGMVHFDLYAAEGGGPFSLLKGCRREIAPGVTLSFLERTGPETNRIGFDAPGVRIDRLEIWAARMLGLPIPIRKSA